MNTPDQPKRAAAYYRISTLVHGQSIQNQSVPVREYIRSKSLKLTGEYSDEGISGAKEKRKGLDALLADARRGKFQILVVMEISRLARDSRHLLNLLFELKNLSISVVSLREGFSSDSSMGSAMIAMIGVLMQVDRDLLRERIKSALQVKKLAAKQTNNGWTCGRPSVLTPDICRRIIELRGQGLTIRGISLALDRKVGKTTVERILREYRQKRILSEKPD